MKSLYFFGRFLQAVALIIMPFSIWVGQLGHNESGAITIFLSSIAVFFMGWLLVKRC